MNNKQYLTLMWVVTLTISGILIFIGISLAPHFRDIGNVATAVVYIYLGCAAMIGPSFTLFKMYRWYIERNVITRGDVIATVDTRGKIVDHLSAAHEQAKQPYMLPAPVEEKPEAPDETIIELYNDGQVTLEQIAKSLNLSYYKVQSTIAVAKQKGLIHRR
jgi:hypothetical protein